jgi:AAA+ superfamily predicted ATPase
LVFEENPVRYMPTVGTALFILAGNDLAKFIEYDDSTFQPQNILFRKDTLQLETATTPGDRYCSVLSISEDKYELFKSGRYRKPSLSHEFPAEEVTTSLHWEDIVLPADTRRKAKDMLRSLHVRTLIPKDMDILRYKKLAYRALFYGPPGTGKTVTAGVFGKLLEQPVYRIDLSQVVSRYVGETEKNLSRLFNTAESKGWILFFDEADALFSKRVTDIKSANDHYANLEVNYLLQRIEHYDGTLILGTNHADNMDEAFKRRFDTVIAFPLPEKEERLQLWNLHIGRNCTAAADLNLDEIANFYQLTGSEIAQSVFRAVELLTAAGEGYELLREVLVDSIRYVCENVNKGFAHPDVLMGKTQQNGRSVVVSSSFTPVVHPLHTMPPKEPAKPTQYTANGDDLQGNYQKQQKNWQEAMEEHLKKSGYYKNDNL